MENRNIWVFGHRNPDTDSVCSAVALANLKKELGMPAKAGVLGDIAPETQFVLDRHRVPAPALVKDVKTQVMDLNADHVASVEPKTTILESYQVMEQKRIRTLPVCTDGKLQGLITMTDIAMDMIQGDIDQLSTTSDAIVRALGGEILTGTTKPIKGRILVMALNSTTLAKEATMDENTITIVGDRIETIVLAIEAGVKLIVLTGGKRLPDTLVQLANSQGVTVVSVETDTYTTARKITLCNHVESIMRREVIRFRPEETLDNAREKMRDNPHTLYPVVSASGDYHGFIGRQNLLNPRRKQVILVDHNEAPQSAVGIDEAEILEIVDHHKLGNIRTAAPIRFTNKPVGSTCTIVYQMYRDQGVDINKSMAGLMLSGIISDTLFMKSPTTTREDVEAMKALNGILGLDMESYAMEMFKEGSKLEGRTVEDIIEKDFKIFEAGRRQIGIGQVFSMDIEGILSNQEAYVSHLKKIHEQERYALTMLVVTDIIKEGSYLLYHSDDEAVLTMALNTPAQEGMFAQWIVSRKKQIVPALVDAYRRMDEERSG